MTMAISAKRSAARWSGSEITIWTRRYKESNVLRIWIGIYFAKRFANELPSIPALLRFRQKLLPGARSPCPSVRHYFYYPLLPLSLVSWLANPGTIVPLRQGDFSPTISQLQSHTRFIKIASPRQIYPASLVKVNSTSLCFFPLTSCSLKNSGTLIASNVASRPTPWKKGIENRAPCPAGGDITRWVVEVQIPCVIDSIPCPIATTNVPWIGGQSIHSPMQFCACSPRCSVA
jgi:hypothetical protein